MWEKLEDYSKCEQRLLLVDSHSNRVSRADSELLESELNKGCSGLMSLAGIENWDSTVENWLSIKIENRVSTYFWTVLYMYKLSSTLNSPVPLRDGPLEKLWGEGEFSSRRNFFSLLHSLYEFFFAHSMNNFKG